MLARSLLFSATVRNGAADVACVSVVQMRFRRRVLAPPVDVVPKYEKVYKEVPIKDRDWLEDALKCEREGLMDANYKRLKPITTKLPDNSNAVYFPDTSKRIGLIGQKIGMTYQWLQDGERLLCTMIHIPDNHVLQVYDPQTWYKRALTGKRKAFGPYGPRWNVIVGAKNTESIFLTDAYRRIFTRVNVPVKEHIAGFVCSEDAVVPPGTKLDIRHFSVGQYVNVSGKTIDYGFQGAVRRWGFKGQPQLGTTKSHRRVGSTGSKGDARVWPGKRSAGHMGYEWRHMVGLKVLRINPIKQVLYVRGCVPGDQGETLLIKDSLCEKKVIQNPPFPTYIPDGEEELCNPDLHAIYNVTSRDVYSPELFRFNQPSILYTEAHETKVTTRDKSKAKIAKVKK